MREQELKLANVKKSCDVARKVTKVFSILLIVASVLCLISGITIFAVRDDVNDHITIEGAQDGVLRFTFAADGMEEVGGYVTVDDITTNGLIGVKFDLEKVANEGDVAELLMGECYGGFIICVIMTAIFIMIQKAFILIKESDTPFHPAVLKRLKLVFVIITIAALLFAEIGTAVICGIVFWCIYCILDYGFVLQQEVDETL